MVLYPEKKVKIKLFRLSKKHEKNRNSLRKKAIKNFFKEKSGQGAGNLTSKYKYIVEKLEDGSRIYLTRPAVLNKGFDFIIHVEGIIFSNGKDNPTHNDIINDLKNKKNNQAKEYNRLLELIKGIYLCKDPERIYLKNKEELSKINTGYSVEIILKTIKWLFIEQDVRYWNWSGRNKFWEVINKL